MPQSPVVGFKPLFPEDNYLLSVRNEEASFIRGQVLELSILCVLGSQYLPQPKGGWNSFLKDRWEPCPPWATLYQLSSLLPWVPTVCVLLQPCISPVSRIFHIQAYRLQDSIWCPFWTSWQRWLRVKTVVDASLPCHFSSIQTWLFDIGSWGGGGGGSLAFHWGKLT